MKLFFILAVLIFGNVHGTSPIRPPPTNDVVPSDQIVCTMEYLICPSGQERIVNGCDQTCVPCGKRSPPVCPRGYTARQNPPAENTCLSYTCMPLVVRPPIRPPITTLPIEPRPPITTLPIGPRPPIRTLPIEPVAY